MGEKLWGRLINAAVLATYVPIVGTVWSGAWDDLAASLYVRFVGPAPAVLAAYRVKATVITAASVFVVAFYGPYLADFCRSLWGLTLMRDSGPAEPAYTLNVYDLHVRVATSLLMSGASSTVASANSIYDRRQTGELRAWGRVSRGFPSTPKRPWPTRRPISASFWRRNTIDEIDHTLTHSGPWGHREDPALTISVPISKWFRSRAIHYWDLVFDPKNARRLWPLRNDWMGSQRHRRVAIERRLRPSVKPRRFQSCL
jgi:hypothetical protein